MSSRAVIQTDSAPAAIGPYSQAVRAGDFIFCSGQVPLDPDSGELAGVTHAQQTTQCLHNLSAVAEAAGAALADAARLTVYTTDMGAFGDINEAYAAFFDGEPPARAAVGVMALPKGALVEVDAILYAPVS
jgi:2-iminobutanoate/2-iminopropanoate deaminase